MASMKVALILVTVFALFFSQLALCAEVEGKWEPLDVTGAPPLEREGHSCAVVGNKLYLSGGRSGVTTFHNTLHILELDTNKWQPSLSETDSVKRSGHSVTEVEGKLYLFGGRTGVLSYTNELSVFNTLTSRWVKVETTGIPPSSRQAHSAVAYNKKIVIYGGSDGSSRLSDIYVFDTETNTWTAREAAGEGAGKREGHKAAVVGNKMFIFGGFDGKVFTNVIYALDLDTFEWTTVGDDKPRASHSASVYNNRVYIFGGINAQTRLNDLQIFNTDLGSWEDVRIASGYVSPRQGHCGAFSDGKFYIFGGSVSWTQYYNDIHVFKPNVDESAGDQVIDPDKIHDLTKMIEEAVLAAKMFIKQQHDTESSSSTTTSTRIEVTINNTLEEDANDVDLDLEAKIQVWREIGEHYKNMLVSRLDVRNITSYVTNYMQDITVLQGEKSTLLDLLRSLIDGIKDDLDKLKKKEAEVLDLQRQREEAEHFLGRITDKLRKLEDEVFKYQEQKREMTRSVEISNKRSTELNLRLKQLSDIEEKSGSDYANLQSRESSLLADLQAVRESINNATASEALMISQSVEANQNMTNLRNNLERLERLLAEVEKLNAKHDTLSKELQDYLAVFNHLIYQIYVATDGSMSITAPEMSTVDASYVSNMLAKAIAELSAKRARLQAELQSIDLEIKRYSERAKELKDEEKRILSDLEKVRSKMSTALDDKRATLQEREAAKREWTDSVSKFERETIELRQVETELKKKEQQRDDSRDDLVTKTREVNEKTTGEEKARRDLDDLKRSLVGRHQQLLQTTRKCKSKSASLDNLRREIVIQQKDYDQQRTSIVVSREKLKELLRKAERQWQDQVDRLEKRIKDLESKLTDCKERS